MVIVEKASRQRQTYSQKHEIRESKKNNQSFLCCPNLKLDDPRTMVFLGLLATTGFIGTYQYMNANPAQATTSDPSPLKPAVGNALEEPSVVVPKTLFFPRLAPITSSGTALTCENQAHALAQVQKGNLPPYVVQAPHPGTYSITTSSSSFKRENIKIILLDRPETDTHHTQTEYLSDYHNRKTAINYANGLSELSSFSIEKFKNALNQIHSLVVGQQDAAFRDTEIMIMHPNIPKIHQVAKVKLHFKDSKKFLLDYTKLQEVISQHRHAPVFKGLSELEIWEGITAGIMRSDDSYYDYLQPICQKFYTFNHLTSQQIESAIEDLWTNVQLSFPNNPIRAAAQLHMGLVETHGYIDGNGGTTRILTQILLQESGYPAFPILSENKYTTAVYNAMQQKDIKPFEDYLRDQICRITAAKFENGAVLEKIASSCSARASCKRELIEVMSELGI